MRFPLACCLSVALIAGAWASPPNLQSPLSNPTPLNASVYDSWKSIRRPVLSRDGVWLAAAMVPQEGDAAVVIKNLNDGRIINLPRSSGVQFSKDSMFAVGMVDPPFADVRAAKRKKTKPEDMPKGSLAIVNLQSGAMTQVDKVASFTLPAEDSGWVIYKLEAPKEAATPTTPKPIADAKEPPKPKEKKPGQPLVIRNLFSAKEETIPFVTQTAFAKKGNAVIFATATKDGKGDGVTFYDLKKGVKTVLMTAKGDYPQLAIDNSGEVAAFEFRPDLPDPKTPPKEDDPPVAPLPAELYFFKSNIKKPEKVGSDSLPKGWAVNEKSAIRFSDRGTRLVYATHPIPPPPQKEVPEDEKVSVDVWTWQDAKLMPQQLVELETERNRGYTAVFEVGSRKSMQLAEKELPTVEIADKDDGRYALARTTTPYDREASWDPDHEDVYLIDLKTNVRTLVAKHQQLTVQMSPKGNYVALFDDSSKSWISIDTANGKRTTLSAGIATPLTDELFDSPASAPPYGIVGWFSETNPIVADRFDLWQCDATGKSGPRRLTQGRSLGYSYRPITLDPDAIYLPSANLLLSVFDDNTKQSGVYVFNDGDAKRLVMADKLFGGFAKARNADRLLFTRQDSTEFPDVWTTDLKFESPSKQTDANPQLKNYLWGKAELVRWTSLDGVPLSGILYKPANFDFGKQYPMVTYFYERNSDTLNAFHSPGPSASIINPAYMASNGYCVFIPDIPYRIGYPGYSALSAVIPGVQSIVARGYVDPKRLGVEGMSWGGYEVAYLVTQTNIFCCAEAGAPVGDMFSAYGGIRYGSGIVREFQYEHTQSRIGGTPWDSTLRYLENSPVFFADKIQTPLMIMSNDKDGAVPHTQGIELFTALRRLNKPSWMVVYNGEDHNLVERKNRKDFDVRLYQFFDHYLKGAPLPEWMAKGVPAVDKGRDLGLGLMGQ